MVAAVLAAVPAAGLQIQGLAAGTEILKGPYIQYERCCPMADGVRAGPDAPSGGTEDTELGTRSALAAAGVSR
jgi:hypothetical protein